MILSQAFLLDPKMRNNYGAIKILIFQKFKYTARKKRLNKVKNCYKKISKEIKRDSYCQCKVGKAITLIEHISNIAIIIFYINVLIMNQKYNIKMNIIIYNVNNSLIHLEIIFLNIFLALFIT